MVWAADGGGAFVTLYNIQNRYFTSRPLFVDAIKRAQAANYSVAFWLEGGQCEATGYEVYHMRI